ncbi:MAG: hydrogenase maturation protease, partial [Dehalococcoidia bacterium]|nr:hydrogenase maturation protease [Dehalococcoidia bacterium]
GNLLCRDDGIGVRAVMEMQGQGKYSGIRLIDGGTSPDLISLLDEDVGRLIIVDALRGGGHPGYIYHLELREENIADGTTTSLHGMGILDSLKLMRQLGQQPPQVTVIGIEPADISHGLHLSPVVEAKLPDIIRAVKSEIDRPD